MKTASGRTFGAISAEQNANHTVGDQPVMQRLENVGRVVAGAENVLPAYAPNVKAPFKTLHKGSRMSSRGSSRSDSVDFSDLPSNVGGQTVTFAPAMTSTALTTRPAAAAQPAMAAGPPAGSIVWTGTQMLKLPFSKVGQPELRAFRVFRAADIPVDAIMLDGGEDDDDHSWELYLGYRHTSPKKGLLGMVAGSKNDKWQLHPLSSVSWVACSSDMSSPVFNRCREKGIKLPSESHCFTVMNAERSIDVVCGSAKETSDWVTGLISAIAAAKAAKLSFYPNSSSYSEASLSNSTASGTTTHGNTSAPQASVVPIQQQVQQPQQQRSASNLAQQTAARPQQPQRQPNPWEGTDDEGNFDRQAYFARALFDAVRGRSADDVVLALDEGCDPTLLEHQPGDDDDGDAHQGDNALTLACRINAPQIVKICLARGVPFMPHGEDGPDALQVAVQSGSLACVREIMSVASNGDGDVQLILGRTDANGNTPLHVACEKGYAEIAGYLVSRNGHEIDKQNKQGRTPLHCACANASGDAGRGPGAASRFAGARKANGGRATSFPADTACEVTYPATVQVLLQNFAEAVLTWGDINGDCPLHLAAMSGDEGIVQAILDTGAANPSIINRRTGLTPIDIAAQFGHDECASMLQAFPGQEGEYTVSLAELQARRVKLMRTSSLPQVTQVSTSFTYSKGTRSRAMSDLTASAVSGHDAGLARDGLASARKQSAGIAMAGRRSGNVAATPSRSGAGITSSRQLESQFMDAGDDDKAAGELYPGYGHTHYNNAAVAGYSGYMDGYSGVGDGYATSQQAGAHSGSYAYGGAYSHVEPAAEAAAPVQPAGLYVHPWQQGFDAANDNYPYWFNVETGESSWEVPPAVQAYWDAVYGTGTGSKSPSADNSAAATGGDASGTASQASESVPSKADCSAATPAADPLVAKAGAIATAAASAHAGDGPSASTTVQPSAPASASVAPSMLAASTADPSFRSTEGRDDAAGGAHATVPVTAALPAGTVIRKNDASESKASDSKFEHADAPTASSDGKVAEAGDVAGDPTEKPQVLDPRAAMMKAIAARAGAAAAGSGAAAARVAVASRSCESAAAGPASPVQHLDPRAAMMKAIAARTGAAGGSAAASTPLSPPPKRAPVLSPAAKAVVAAASARKSHVSESKDAESKEQEDARAHASAPAAAGASAFEVGSGALAHQPAAPAAAVVAAAPPSASASVLSDPAISKHVRMLRMGVPIGGTVQAMRKEGVDDAKIDAFQAEYDAHMRSGGSAATFGLSSTPSSAAASSSSAPKTPDRPSAAAANDAVKPAAADLQAQASAAVAADPRFEKFVKMKKMGVPLGAIKGKMAQDSLTAADQKLFLSAFASQSALESMGLASPTKINTSGLSKPAAAADAAAGVISKPSFVAASAVKHRLNLPTMKLHWDPLKLDETAYKRSLWGRLREQQQQRNSGASSSSGSDSKDAGDSKDDDGADGAHSSEMEKDDLAMLESLFTNKAAPAAASGSAKAGASKGSSRTSGASTMSDDGVVTPSATSAPQSKMTLLDFKRANNLNISLAQFRRFPSYNAVISAVHQLDEGMLPKDILDKIVLVMPTSEELATVKRGVAGPPVFGDVSRLMECDKWFLSLADVPRFSNKVNGFMCKLTFASAAAELKSRAQLLHAACSCIMDSKRLAAVLASVLSIGNILNADAAHLQAAAISLDSLSKLATTKGSDKKTTLLDALVMLVQRKDITASKSHSGTAPGYPALLDWPADISDLAPAGRIDLNDVKSELTKLKLAVAAAGKEADAEEKDLQKETAAAAVAVAAEAPTATATDAPEKPAAAGGDARSAMLAEMMRKRAGVAVTGAATSTPAAAGPAAAKASKHPCTIDERKNFVSSIRSFGNDAKVQLSGLEKAVTDAESAAIELAQYFGEDPKSTSPAKVFAAISDFASTFKASVLALRKRKAAEAKAAK